MVSRNVSELSQLIVQISDILRFWATVWGLETTYDVLLGLIGKRILDFNISVNWTFFARCYGWGATSENRSKIGDFAPTRSIWPNISDRRGRPHQAFFLSQNLGKWSLVWYKNAGKRSFVLSQITRFTDRRTDKILIATPRLHYMYSWESPPLSRLSRLGRSKSSQVVSLPSRRRNFPLKSPPNFRINSSQQDEIANVNFLYDDIVHALQNAIDSCINSARDRRGYVLERRFTKVSEITPCDGHYVVQGYSRSPILVPIESSYTTSY